MIGFAQTPRFTYMYCEKAAYVWRFLGYGKKIKYKATQNKFQLRLLIFLLLKPNSWTKSRQRVFSLLFTVTSIALPWDFYFSLNLTQPLTVFTDQLLYIVKEKGVKPDIKPYPLFLQFKKSIQKLQVWKRTLKIMPWNLIEIVCSWIRLL
jgi:hypothetical protein